MPHGSHPWPSYFRICEHACDLKLRFLCHSDGPCGQAEERMFAVTNKLFAEYQSWKPYANGICNADNKVAHEEEGRAQGQEQ